MNIGDIVHYIENEGKADEKKVVALVVDIGENAWGEVKAFVKKLEADASAVLEQTGGDTPVPIVKPVAPPAPAPVAPVAPVAPIGSTGPTGSTGPSTGGSA